MLNLLSRSNSPQDFWKYLKWKESVKNPWRVKYKTRGGYDVVLLWVLCWFENGSFDEEKILKKKKNRGTNSK